jgi:hypothetical protein
MVRPGHDEHFSGIGTHRKGVYGRGVIENLG